MLSLQLVDKVVFYHHHANIGYLKELFMVYVVLLVIGTIYFKKIWNLQNLVSSAVHMTLVFFYGSPIQGKHPIYVAIYVDKIIYFSLVDDVEQYFCLALSQKIKVDFLGDAEWYIGIKFVWNKSSDGSVSCHFSQEGYAAAIVEEIGLSQANKSPLMTSFRSGLPINAIPHFDTLPDVQAPLISKMQCWMGMLNWLQQCTHPDLATNFSLLATHMHCPSPDHLDAAKYVGHYILSTMDLGLVFSTNATSSLES